MRMYIANCGKQFREVWFRIPGFKDPRMLAIGVLSQEQVSGDLLPEEVDAIVEQLGIYGMVHVNDIDRNRDMEVSMIYQVDKPITAHKIGHALEHNQAIMERKGEETRRAAAIKTNEFLDHQLRDNELPNLKMLEMTIEEKKPRWGAEFPSVTKFFRQGKERGDGIRVSRGEEGESSGKRPARRRA